MDASYEDNDFYIGVTDKVLNEIGAADTIFVSIKEDINLNQLIEKIKEKIFADNVDITLLILYTRGDLNSHLCDKALVKNMDYVEEGTLFEVGLSQEDYMKLRKQLLVYQTDRH